MGAKRGLLFAIVVIGALAVMAAEPAFACTCAGSASPCDSYGPGSVIFVGTVTARTKVTSATAPSRREPLYEFTLSVSEPIVGVDEKSLTVQTATDTAACGYPFEVGKSYLVYTSRQPDGTLAVSYCSNTRPLESAANHLAILRQLQSGSAVVSRVAGVVQQHELELNGLFYRFKSRPLDNVVVNIRGDNVNEHTRTDAQGRFVFEGLPPGEYTLAPELPAGLKHMFKDRSAKIKAGRCGYDGVPFFLTTDAPLGGAVTGEPGGMLNQVEVTAIRVDGDYASAPRNRASTFVFTDDKGIFSFDGLPPGRYVIGVNATKPPSKNSPFATVFYPAAASFDEAKPIDVIAGRQTRADIRVGAPLAKRILTGIVVNQAGEPVPNARLNVRDAASPLENVFGIYADSDADGRFSVTIFQGRQYIVFAESFRPNGVTQVVRVAESGDPVNVRLLMTPRQ